MGFFPGVLRSKCVNCLSCVDVCAQGVLKIFIERDSETKVVGAWEDNKNCNNCGECKAICPEDAIVIFYN